ncbi:MAG: hypothetical protein AAGA75_04510 [Cyanobacteria bacterium P01_E01_bin.6]
MASGTRGSRDPSQRLAAAPAPMTEVGKTATQSLAHPTRQDILGATNSILLPGPHRHPLLPRF